MLHAPTHARITLTGHTTDKQSAVQTAHITCVTGCTFVLHTLRIKHRIRSNTFTARCKKSCPHRRLRSGFCFIFLPFPSLPTAPHPPAFLQSYIAKVWSLCNLHNCSSPMYINMYLLCSFMLVLAATCPLSSLHFFSSFFHAIFVMLCKVSAASFLSALFTSV